MFELQPTLNGELLKLRPVGLEDYSALFAAASDPLIWAQHPNPDRYKEEVFKDYFDGAIKSGGALVVIDVATNKIIGSSRYYGLDENESQIEIGWTFLATEYWGGKYNGELKKLMIDHAFTFADIVIFWVGETNWRSQRAMEKIGGVRRPGIHVRNTPGATDPHVIFEIKR